MSKTTITVRMEVEVDEAAWTEEYGEPRGRIVDSVEDYILNQLTQSPAAEADALEVTAYAVYER